MANSGDLINFSSLGTEKIMNTINKDNPGANGSAYIMVSPSFACWARTDGPPVIGAEPKMWVNFQYWNGKKWVNIYTGEQGQYTSTQLNVNYSYDTGNKTYYYNGPPTPILFQAKRIQGEGGRVHCRWIFMQLGHAGEKWYNSYIKGKKIYGLSNAIGIYTASDGKGPATSAQLAMSNIQEQLPLIPEGQSTIDANAINMVTCLPLGYTR